jgi:ubiquinone biosynthesis monooxygenase Coq7
MLPNFAAGPDAFIRQIDRALRTVFATAGSRRPYPDAGVEEAEMSETEKRHAAGLMRVNHSGEVCAQALYQGQALTARNPEAARALIEASEEETEHLAWCDKWNLGFLAETERQVEGHLNEHLSDLPAQDAKSRAIVEQMKVDEMKHAETAIMHGGVPLPTPVKQAMQLTSKVLTFAAYRV